MMDDSHNRKLVETVGIFARAPLKDGTDSANVTQRERPVPAWQIPQQ